MGKNVFLSYAEEDSEIAQKIAKQLQSAGFDIFDWRDPSKRGQRFVERIQNEIRVADVFVVVLSNDYLNSNYCNREVEFAIQLEQEDENQLIYIVLVESVETRDAGFLAAYDRFDLTENENKKELKKMIQILRGENGATLDLHKKDNIFQPDFQNREEELDELISNLTKPSGGVHFWQILAPPQMGKTWFLNQLASKLQENSQPWRVSQIDLNKANSLALRSDKAVLLSAFFGLKINTPIDAKKVTEIARHVGKSNKYWLLLLDGSELLSDPAVVGLRETLGQIDTQLRSHKKIRLAFVAATRKNFDFWIKFIPEYPRFKSRSLSPFTNNVVYSSLENMAIKDGINKGEDWLDKTAKVLQRVTEGLPALLTLYLDWIKRNAYLYEPNELESETLFIQLAKPYIEETILSIDSLLPGAEDANRIRPQCEAVQNALYELCIYRRFISRYLEDCMQDNTALLRNVRRLGWKTNDVHNALKRTYITQPVPNDLWTVFYPAVRRLLFRYYYEAPDKQANAHQRASFFYKERWREWEGTDKAIVLLEHLWHFIEYQRLSKEVKLKENILKFAEDIFKSGLKSDLYSPQELANIIENRMSGDREFQNTVHRIDTQLSGQLLEILSL